MNAASTSMVSLPPWASKQRRAEARAKAEAELRTLENAVPTLVECYLMERVHATVFPWLQLQHAHEDELKLAELLHYLRYHTQADIGIRPEFQCSLAEAVKEVSSLGEMVRPLLLRAFLLCPSPVPMFFCFDSAPIHSIHHTVHNTDLRP